MALGLAFFSPRATNTNLNAILRAPGSRSHSVDRRAQIVLPMMCESGESNHDAAPKPSNSHDSKCSPSCLMRVMVGIRMSVERVRSFFIRQ